jgi:nucleoside phosphorylase
MSVSMPCAVILTALRVEYKAVREHLTNVKEITHDRGTVYERGKFVAEGRTWDVGIVEIEAGNAGAAVAAERAITHFKPNVILFVGIAGGIKDVQLGDVVAATKVYGYESGKAEETFKPRPEVGLADYGLKERAKAEARKNDWFKRVSVIEPIPGVFVAAIAAGEKVIASTKSEVYQFLRSNYGHVIAVEMEGFGFLEAARANQHVSAMVIRGISDLIDGKAMADGAGSQEIASRNASAFAFQILAKFQPPNETTAVKAQDPGYSLPLGVPYHFSFGKIETTELIVDGDGCHVYSPQLIDCRYDPTPIELPLELQEIKNKISDEEKKKEANGESYRWNGNVYALKGYRISRTDNEDQLKLRLEFGPSDYYTYLATNASLDTEYVFDEEINERVTLRQKYLKNINWSNPSLKPVTYFSSTFGLCACLISRDDQMLITRRSEMVGSWKGLYHMSINEGMQRNIDSGLNNTPDPYKALIRGTNEELGIDITHEQIKLLTFNVDTVQSAWGLHGFIESNMTMSEILNARRNATKDKWEAMELIPLKFEIDEIVKFVFSNQSWSPHGLSCIYHVLVYKFGKDYLESTIKKFN